MPENYNALTAQEKQEVNTFVSYLIYKRLSAKKNDSRMQRRLEALKEYAGCMGGLWKDDDPLEYQRRLREDREIV